MTRSVCAVRQIRTCLVFESNMAPSIIPSIFPNLFLSSLGAHQDQFQVAHDTLSPCRAIQHWQLSITGPRFIRNYSSTVTVPTVL